eukprot:gnl/TRDRNA2_/TRDRNA2_177841_c7_seq1.p1 gnl/TRDRNA2_/TRDRNA2_177841_c7~~gnl/TRDRNA2_/TRDRNA2_177841_c7_seq1.p1  ORF type:complete len:661 (+),score=251.50 gnl/TRDRNA2_/TRDRNA2_177841_c7_seq1:252-1985(+)
MAEAGSVREKEAAAFAAASADLKTNLGAMDKAIPAIEQGSAGSFLQTESAAALKNYVMVKGDLADVDRQDVLAFLSNSADYAPQSGQIVGILKTLKDEMTKELADTTAAEDDAIKTYEELLAAKKKETEALTAQIEEKSVRFGDVSVEISTMKNDLEDTTEAVAEDTKFAADLEKQCATKEAEWDERCKLRSEEILAIADTIKILNDDDALELFKKTLPGSASFVQITVTEAATRTRALALIKQAQNKPGAHRQQLDLISLALHGKARGFEVVTKMIEGMIENLHKEQEDDDAKKEYCLKQFDEAEDKKKGLENDIADLDTAIADAEEAITTLKAEIEALSDGIKALDKSVDEATEQRKEENQDFKELMAADAACKEIIGFAKNRLNKFYNPKLYKAPPKRELTEGASFVQIRMHRDDAAPPPPPETFGAYSKKSDESGGVIKMMDMMMADMDTEMLEAEAGEKDAQKEYEQMMKDSADKRAQDSKSMTDKESELAQTEGALQQHKSDKMSTGKELSETFKYIAGLHGECDWLLSNFETRKEARAGEVESLKEGMDVLNGAEYSLLQSARASHKFGQ